MRILRQPFQDVVDHVEGGYPEERCGVLLGAAGVVTAIARAKNQQVGSAPNRYLIDPRAYDRIEREADRRGVQVLGIYHSHPDVAAQPSEFDRRHAWPEWSYLIVAVVQGRLAGAQSWRLQADGRQFDEEPVEIVDQATTIPR